MAILTTDLEYLETYLDGALGPDETDALRKRLATDSELSAALQELQSQRDIRQVAWASLEPDNAVAERLTWRVRGAIADQQRFDMRPGTRWRFSRIGSVAAACVVFGFFAGWMGRANSPITPAVAPAGPGGNPMVVNRPVTLTPGINFQGTPIMVPVTNEYGQVVAWQQFRNAGEAKDFTEDLHRANRLPSPAPTDDRIKLLSDEQF